MYLNMMGPSVCLSVRPSVSQVSRVEAFCAKKERKERKERDGGIMYVHDMCQFSPDSRPITENKNGWV
jgi:hypothetical protein